MKTINFFKTALLTIALFVCGNVGAQTATQSSFTSISANNIGGDSNLSYECGKGGGTTAPAINREEIRLYQNSAGTGGGFITITAAEGCTITEATIGSSMNTSVAYTLNSESEKSSTASIAQNGTYTTPAISANSITFHCMGTDKNSRLYVNHLSVTYTSNSSVEAPTFNPEGGTYTTVQSVTISAENGATIYYTTNGEVPTTETSTIYSAPIEISTSTTIKAIAVKEGISSSISSAEYIINLPTLATPSATEATGISSNGFTANWNTVEHATTYEVNVWTSEEFVPSGEKGTITNPYSFEEYINGNVSGTVSVYGYIVGFATSGDIYKTTEITENTNIALAAAPGAAQTFIPVKLDDPLREAWGLGSNPTYLNKLVIVTATKETYFNNPNGLKNTSAISEFALNTVTPIAGSPFTVEGATCKEITGLAAETTYHYNVVAKADGYTASEVSNTISATTAAEVVEPTITISGDDLVETEGLYSVALGDTKFSTKTTKTFTLTATGVTSTVEITPERGSDFFITAASEQATENSSTLTFTPDENGEVNATFTFSNRINSEFNAMGFENGEQLMQIYGISYGVEQSCTWYVKNSGISKTILVSFTPVEESAGTGLCDQPEMEGVVFNGEEIINSLNLDVVVYNAIGQMVVRSNENINMSAYPAGVYVIKAANGASMKIVK